MRRQTWASQWGGNVLLNGKCSGWTCNTNFPILKAHFGHCMTFSGLLKFKVRHSRVKSFLFCDCSYVFYSPSVFSFYTLYLGTCQTKDISLHITPTTPPHLGVLNLIFERFFKILLSDLLSFPNIKVTLIHLYFEACFSYLSKDGDLSNQNELCVKCVNKINPAFSFFDSHFVTFF